MRHPIDGDHQEADRESQEIRHEIAQRAGQVVACVRWKLNVDDKQCDGDGEDCVTEEDQPLETEAVVEVTVVHKEVGASRGRVAYA